MEERRVVKDFISHDPLLSRFISDVFLFENIPAGDRKPDDIYLREVEQCDIYLAILGNKYGWKNEDGKSPRTALRELRQLTDIGIFAKVGGTGQSTHYVIAKAKPVTGKRGGNPS